MQFDPKFCFWFGIAITVLIGIGSGSVSLTNALPPDWIPYVVAWTKILSFFGSAILTAMHGFSSGSSGPFVSPSAAPAPKAPLMLFAIGLSALALAWAGPANAQNRQPQAFRPTGNLVKDIADSQGTAESNPLDALAAKIRKLSLEDFKYAAALAHATGNAVTAPCWDAWVKLLTAQQQPLNGADGNPLKEPDPHLATDIERLSEMVAQMQPRSDLNIACAPLASAAQKDAATLIGAVLSGGALGLFKLPIIP
jgi:hypothetical protein